MPLSLTGEAGTEQYAMISLLLTLVGLLSLSTGIVLHSVRGLLIDFTNMNKK
jgi:hypothetical protein